MDELLLSIVTFQDPYLREWRDATAAIGALGGMEFAYLMQARLADYGVEQIDFFPLIFNHGGNCVHRSFAFLADRAHSNPKR